MRQKTPRCAGGTPSRIGGRRSCFFPPLIDGLACGLPPSSLLCPVLLQHLRKSPVRLVHRIGHCAVRCWPEGELYSHGEQKVRVPVASVRDLGELCWSAGDLVRARCPCGERDQSMESNQRSFRRPTPARGWSPSIPAAEASSHPLSPAIRLLSLASFGYSTRGALGVPRPR